MSLPFPRLIEISPTAHRDLGQAGKYFIIYECIFPAEWDNFFLWRRLKKYYVIVLYIIKIVPTIVFTRNTKQLLFYLYISKEEVIKTSCCRWIANRYRPLPKHKMRVSRPDMATNNRTEQFFFKFVFPILNIGFLQYFPV